VAYDALAESRRLLADGPPDTPFRLTRRRRFLPVACDVDGDVATTLFVRRGVSGNPWLELWALRFVDGEWTLLGGGAGDHYEELFEPRLDQAALGGLARPYGTASTRLDPDRVVPGGAKFAHHATIRLAAEVETLAVEDRRIPVPGHGVAVVTWRSRRPPVVRALDAEGRSLGDVALSGA
jgi:hypothetical protein